MKYYAVRVGKKPGIYTTWEKCKAQVHRYPGAVFKSFATKPEAEDFMENKKPQKTQKNKNTEKSVLNNHTIIEAYTDGSYDANTGNYSYGVVIISPDGEKYLSKRFAGSEAAESRNVAGEIAGAEATMRYCLDNKIRSVTIYYDYEGVEKWCTGEWKTNKTLTREYKSFYDSIKNRLDVKFVKVKGHSGNHYNDMADYLAKKALGI